MSSSIDLLPLPSLEKVNLDAKKRAEFVIKLQETTKENIERMTEKYRVAGSHGRKEVTFEPGDLVWLHLRKERFPDFRKSKLMPRADGPFKVLERINDNAYKLDLPTNFGISPTFNIADLHPYFGENNELESRTTQIQEGEDDEDITTIDTLKTNSQQGSPSDHELMPNIQGPITRARARQLNYQVKSFLVSHKLVTVNRPLPNDVLLVRNLDKDQLWCINAPTFITQVGDAKGFSSAINYHSNLNYT